jgi:hypothetical protein
MSFGPSKYVVCVGKEYMPGKNKFTEVGVGFQTRDGKGIRLQLDLTLILSPKDNVFVFLRNSQSTEGEAIDGD